MSDATRTVTGVGRLFPPLDRHLGIPRRGASSLLTRKICEANEAGSFPKASRLLGSLAGLDIAPKRVQLVTEAVGEVLRQERDAATDAFFHTRPHAAPSPEPVELLVISADGGRVQTRQKDPDLKWKEDKIGLVYNAVPSPEQPGVDYEGPPPITRSVVATMANWEQLGDHLSTCAHRRGYAHAQQKVFLSDGAQGIRSQRERCFPDAPFALDWGHATENLHGAAVAGFGPGRKAERWYERQKDRLWHGHTDRFFRQLSALARRLGPRPPNASEHHPRRTVSNALDYFRTNRAGLDYPTFRQRGWPIGSGVTEATIKCVGKRVKGTEKHWSLSGVEQTLQLTAALLADDGSWDAFWNDQRWARCA